MTSMTVQIMRSSRSDRPSARHISHSSRYITVSAPINPSLRSRKCQRGDPTAACKARRPAGSCPAAVFVGRAPARRAEELARIAKTPDAARARASIRLATAQRYRRTAAQAARSPQEQTAFLAQQAAATAERVARLSPAARAARRAEHTAQRAAQRAALSAAQQGVAIASEQLSGTPRGPRAKGGVAAAAAAAAAVTATPA
jgi:hypothetical protein